MTAFGMAARLVFLVALSFALPAWAEIHIHDSVEWLCERSEIVAFGRLVSVESVAGPGKSRDLITVTMQPEARLEAGGLAKPVPLHFAMRLKDPKPLLEWKQKGTRLVVFLTRTIQAFAHDGRNYDLWPVRETGSQIQQLVDPTAPHTPLLLAAKMSHARTAADIRGACRRADAAMRRRKPPRRATKPHLLETPPESDAFRTLYQGSACYLYVPPRAFPSARDRL